jgi:DNA-binding NarL/FixJ family response regulator
MEAKVKVARILIVDDSYVARKALQKLMTELGHTVVSEAADGSQAFTEYAAHRPDIVTMDLRMQGIDGTEATSKIMATFPEARIIVISATEDRPAILDALERGARHYIIKPVTPEKVSATLDNVLRQKFDPQKYKELIRRLKDAECFSSGLRCSSSKEGEGLIARVLIVDDSTVARKSLREIVTSLGHTVIGEAENGAQAFAEYAQHKPDIVTMDLTMQGINGAEATSKITATFPNARIIVISAMEERRVVLDALERGARHFIIKPVTQEKVSAVLNNVLRQNFDHQKHMELVRKLKGANDSMSAVRNAAQEYLPPYQISPDNRLIAVKINPSLTLISCRTLAIELEEYLTGTPKVLFDFGVTPSLNEVVLAEIDKLIKKIESSSGVVKAVSRNQSFVDDCSFADNCLSLAAVIRYLPS